MARTQCLQYEKKSAVINPPVNFFVRSVVRSSKFPNLDDGTDQQFIQEDFIATYM